MGGSGSGRGMRNRRRTRLFIYKASAVDSFQLYQKIKAAPKETVFKWRGIRLTPKGDRVELTSLDNGVFLEVSFLRISSTPCNFGGARYWFVCPQCLRNTRRIHLIQNKLACRRCLKLVYPSQNETLADRLIRKRNRIWDRLKEDDSFELQPKPKWMHHATYHRLHVRARELSDFSMVAYFTHARRLSSVIGHDPITLLNLQRRLFSTLDGCIGPSDD